MARVAAGYSTAQVCAIAGCSYRQLDVWCRKGWITPSVTAAAGKGTVRRFSSVDVAKVRRLCLASELQRCGLDVAVDRLAALGA